MAAPQGVNFDGSNDYLSLESVLTGSADSKLVAGSFWVRFTSAVGSTEIIWLTDTSLTSTPKFRINRTSGEAITFLAGDSTHNLILFASTSAAFADTDWHHVMFSFDMSDPNKAHIYVDDVSDLSFASVYTDAAIDFSPGGTTVNLVGADGFAGGSFTADFPGDLADFWFAPGVYIDLSIEANRRKFVGASAASSVDLGSDGSTPTGTAPLVFLSGATATWHTNKGTGGGFTENGALGDASANPPDYAGGEPANPTASGSLASGAAAVAGSAAITGRVASGSLKAGGAAISGEAMRQIMAAGAVQAQLAAIVAEASRAAKAQGQPKAQASAVEGEASAFRVLTASGSLLSGPSAIEGTAQRLRILTASGALAAGASAIEGAADRTAKATGALASGAATIVGAATIFVQGLATGTLKAGAAAIESAASRTAKASGALESGAAAVSGASELVHKASGALTAGAASIAGAAVRGAKAAGTLASGAAAIVGRMVINIVRPSFALRSTMSDAPVALEASMTDEVAVSSRMSDEPVALETEIAP